MTETKALYDALYEQQDSEVNTRVKPGADYGDPEAAHAFLESCAVPKDSRIVEVGFGSGALQKHLQDNGYIHVEGIEISDVAVKQAQAAHPELADQLQAFDGQGLPYEDGTLDVLCSFDVIEHIPDVDAHLAEAARVLKPGGRYLFQTPNKPVNALASTLIYRSFTAWRPYHCSLQTAGSLRALAGRHGLSLDRLEMFLHMTPGREASIRTHFGAPGLWAYKFLARAPLALVPNLWGVFQK